MTRSRPPYAPEFKVQMVERVRAGRTPEALAQEFEPSAQTIRNWFRQADLDEGRRSDGLTTAEREELRRLRKENRELKLERDILGKAAAWFAQEGGSIPPKRSDSRKRIRERFPWRARAGCSVSRRAASTPGSSGSRRRGTERTPP